MPSHFSPMHPLTFSPVTVISSVLIFFLAVTSSFASDETEKESLSNCNQTFNCGPLENVSYPFTGGSLPSNCGPPEFRLACNDDSPELTIESLSYRVLRLDQTRKTLALARADLWNNTCPNKFTNSTLNFSIFTYGMDNEDLAIFYGCNYPTQMTVTPTNRFNCTIPGILRDAYYVTGPVPSEPVLKILQCNVSVTVKILKTAADDLTQNRSTLSKALMEGFNVSYNYPYSETCDKCLNSGAQCRFDSNSGQPVCFCGDQPCPEKKKSVSLVIGLAIGGIGIVGIFLGWCIFSIMRSKKSSNLVIRNRNMKSDEYVKAFIMNQGSFAPKAYSYLEIKKMTNSFNNKLGQGGYGNVYKGKLLDGRLVAVKVITELNGSGEEFINEVASISRTSHVNIVTLLGFSYDTSKRVLIYEFMPNGSLDKFIYNRESSTTNCKLELKTLFQIAVGVARGLEYLHRGCNTRILHFDIKPQNILLDEDLCPKIADFGLAKLCQKKESIVSMLGARGTAGYIAPEVFSRAFGGVSHKSDVYSYGMLVLDMVGGRKNVDVGVSQTSEAYFPNYIYKNLNLDENGGNNGVVTEEGEEIERKMILVSLWCIQTVPADRPSMTKVVEMLEGSLESIQIAPKPFLFSPARSVHDSSTTSFS